MSACSVPAAAMPLPAKPGPCAFGMTGDTATALGAPDMQTPAPLLDDAAIRALFDTALAAARDWHAACPVQRGFAPWPDDLAYVPRAPVPVPGIAELIADPGEASDISRPLRDALLAIAPFVEWRLGYTEDEVGADFLRRYGWFELAGPEGHFHTLRTRITVGYWGRGLFYPRHQHEPEELYTVVSGHALFHADGEADLTLAPGQTRLHRANQPHALTTAQSPILTLVFWRGAGLAQPPRISAA